MNLPPNAKVIEVKPLEDGWFEVTIDEGPCRHWGKVQGNGREFDWSTYKGWLTMRFPETMMVLLENTDAK